jgi:hypothetical protein
MRRPGLVVAMFLVACSRDHQAASSGSAVAAKPIAVADAAAPDAPKLATQILRPCDVAGAGVHCTITPKEGALRGKRCWAAVVAIEDHVAAKLRMVTSTPACTGDIAMGVATPLELTFGPKDNLAKACAADNACEVMLSDVDELTKDQVAWRAQLQTQLTDEKTEREQAARDREPADPGAYDKIYEHYVQLSIEDSLNTRWKEHPDRREVEMSIRSPGPMIMMGIIPDNNVLTKGQVSCALAASSASGYRDCFAAAFTDDAGVDDAGVPGD